MAEASRMTIDRSGRVALTVLTLGLAALTAHAGKPRIKVSHSEWDFGEVYAGSTIRHTFRVFNEGDAALSLGMIRGLCATCTVGQASKNPIGPGENATLTLTYEAKSKLGDFRSGVVVHTNDPEEPFKRLIVRGKVIPRKKGPRIHVAPGSLDLGIVARGAIAETSLKIANRGEDVLRITRIGASRHCSAVLAGGRKAVTLLPGKEAEIRLFLDASRLRGVVTEHILVTSNDPMSPVTAVPVTGYVVDSLAEVRLPRGTIALMVGSGGAASAKGSPAKAREIVIRNEMNVAVRAGVSAAKPTAVRDLGSIRRGGLVVLNRRKRGAKSGTQGWTYVVIAIPPPRGASPVGGPRP